MCINSMKTLLAASTLMAAAILLWGQGARNAGPQNPGGRGKQNQGQAGQAAPGVNLPPGSVEGRVMSATGEPLRKVTLTLRPNGRGGGNYSTVSATDGTRP